MPVQSKLYLKRDGSVAVYDDEDCVAMLTTESVRLKTATHVFTIDKDGIRVAARTDDK